MTRSLPQATDDAASSALIFTLALACGVTVANIYYVQPLVGLISHDYGLPLASAGSLVTVTQVGYAAGLLLIVPLADIVENRRLIVSLLGLLVAALVGAAFAPSGAFFLGASLMVGLGASTVQVIVPFAGHLASDESRGRVVGVVVSGLLFGIMLARPVASFIAHFIGHRSVFGLSACAVGLLLAFLFRVLPERRPAGMPYFQALRSLGPLLAATPILHRRGAYQAALFGAFSLFWTVVPLFLSGPRFGFSQIGIGLFSLVGAAGAIVSPYAGQAADRGLTRSVTALSIGGAILALLVALVGGLTSSWILLVIAGLVLDAAAAANLVVGQRAIFAIGAEARGRLNGLYLALFFVGGAFGSLVSGYAFAAGGWTATCIVGLAFPLAAMLYFATERRPVAPDP